MRVKLTLAILSALFFIGCKEKKGSFKGGGGESVIDDNTVVGEEVEALPSEELVEEGQSQEGDALAESPEEEEVILTRTPIDFGVKNSNQIYASLLAVTGVEESQPLADFFVGVEQSLGPFSNQLVDLTAGHVANIFKLSTEVCDAMVADTALAGSFFQGCDLAKAPDALAPADKSCLAEKAAQNFWGMTEDSQTLITMIDSVIPDLAGETNGNVIATFTCANAASALQSIIY